MRFFLDSNVIVSGIVFAGTERRILLATFGTDHAFVISQDVQREVRKVMRQKFPRLREESEEVMALLRAQTLPRRTYEGRSQGFAELRDPDDAHILAAAIVSRCDVVVTGDKDLLVLREVEGVKIIRPSEARKLLAARGPPDKTIHT